jgi:hypothetical protein
MKILEVMSDNKQLQAAGKETRSCHTTIVCADVTEGEEKGKKVILYITDNKYCGENVAPIFELRDDDEKSIRIMSDASNMNNLKLDKQKLEKIINALCMAHGRNKIEEYIDFYPEICNYLLGEIKAIYAVEEKYADSSKKKRYKAHKKYSKRHIDNIYNKIEEVFVNKEVEPNSMFGKVLNYWLRNKEGLTKFLSVKGIRLDNNWAERLLKVMIKQRSRSLFFKTRKSAGVVSGWASVVKTCQENGVNAYIYLNWLQENGREVRKDASKYLPWHYEKSLEVREDTELIAAA